eukprot:g25293.t1
MHRILLKKSAWGLGVAGVSTAAVVAFSSVPAIVSDVMQLQGKTRFSMPELTGKVVRFNSHYPQGMNPAQMSKELQLDASIGELIFNSVSVPGSSTLSAQEFLPLASTLITGNEEEVDQVKFKVWKKNNQILSDQDVLGIVKMGIEQGRYQAGALEVAKSHIASHKDLDLASFRNLLKELKNHETEKQKHACKMCLAHVSQVQAPTRGPLLELGLSTTAGMCSTVAAHPLDSLKVQAQASSEQLARGARSLTQLYAGILPPLASSALRVGLGFCTKDLFEALLNKQAEGERMSLMTISITGICAGLSTAPVIAPVELLKIRAQHAASMGVAVRLTEVARGIYSTNGLGGFFAGSGVTALRLVPGWGVYFWGYEVLKRGLEPQTASLSLGPGKGSSELNHPPSTRTVLLAGGGAGMLAWVASLPFDAIKTRIQIDPARYRGIWACATEMRREGGVRIFFRGLAPTLVRAFISNATLFFTLTKLSSIHHRFFLHKENHLLVKDGATKGGCRCGCKGRSCNDNIIFM